LLVDLFYSLIPFFKKNKIQIFKFGLVGLGSTFLNYCIYSIVYHLTSTINLASFLGYFSGLFTTFYFSKSWTFSKSRYKSLSYTLFLFVFIYFVGGLEMISMIHIVDKLIQNHRIAWICGVFVAAMNNYLCSKYLLFQD
tara:strand:+ start:90 stop:506 length:417 start_codon:yes stop_codon:yes gene_type:complete